MYLQHLLTTTLSIGAKPKLKIEPVTKANILLFGRESSKEMIQTFAALDLMIPQDSWHSMWSSALLEANTCDGIIDHLAKQLNTNPQDALNKFKLKGACKEDDADNNKKSKMDLEAGMFTFT